MIVRADVFGDLKIYVSEALARAYKFFFWFFSVGTFGGLAPPPQKYQKAGYASEKESCKSTDCEEHSYYAIFCKRVCRTHRPVTNVKVSRDKRDVLHENLDSHGLQVRCDVPHSSDFFFSLLTKKNKPIKLY